MKLADLKNKMLQDRLQNTVKIYMPSIKKDLAFKLPLTQDIKTLSRLGVFNQFDINNQLLKLQLFNKLLAQPSETCQLNSNNITIVDFFSFLIAIRKVLNNDLVFSFTCQTCQKQFKHKINVQKLFSKFIFNYQPEEKTFQKLDKNDNIWKFTLKSFSMKNYLYYRYYIERLKEIDMNNPDLLNQEKFIRPILYISQIYKNDEKIEDWNDQLIGTKINFFNALPGQLIIDSSGNQSDQYLATFIAKNFSQEKFLKQIDDIQVKCTNKECGEVYTGLYTFEDFCTF